MGRNSFRVPRQPPCDYQETTVKETKSSGQSKAVFCIYALMKKVLSLNIWILLPFELKVKRITKIARAHCTNGMGDGNIEPDTAKAGRGPNIAGPRSSIYNGEHIERGS